MMSLTSDYKSRDQKRTPTTGLFYFPSEAHSLSLTGLNRNINIGVLPVKTYGADFRMEPTNVRTRIVGQIQHMVSSAIIKDRRFLDDEQLIKSEQ